MKMCCQAYFSAFCMQAVHAGRASTHRKQVVLQQAVAKFNQTRRGNVLEAWRHAAQRRRHNRVALQGALTHLNHQILRVAFTSWRDYVQARLQVCSHAGSQFASRCDMRVCGSTGMPLSTPPLSRKASCQCCRQLQSRSRVTQAHG